MLGPSSSAGLDPILENLAVPLINLHAHDLVSDGKVWRSHIQEISELTGVSTADLVLELIKAFARAGSGIPGTVWLTFASFICPQTGEGKGQVALSRLLGSDAVKLANNAPDGEWKQGFYPDSDFTEIAAGFVWRVLGSPKASCRWHAAHCIRDFATFGNWDVIDALVDRFDSTTAGAFQAPELEFYYMHAKLWLLIALARLAMDYPQRIAKYKDDLLSIVSESKQPHVLMRHFAARALLVCVDSKAFKLPVETLKFVSNVDDSPHPRLRKKILKKSSYFLYDNRSTIFDYDFLKNDVNNLSRTFGKPCWEVTDMMSTIVHDIDPDIKSMYESGGRESRRRGMYRQHSITDHLGWHALFLVAGKLLSDFPITDDRSWYDDPWKEWLGRHLLTHDDGFWLSDGTDRMPIDTYEILLEPKNKEHVITGNQAKILSLVGIKGNRLGEKLVIEGRWFSADNIRVEVSSALVLPEKAPQFAHRLIHEEPMTVWLPDYNIEDGNEYLPSEKNGYVPWVACPSNETCLDRYDPYGVSVANHRPRLASNYSDLCKLTRGDNPFGRVWLNNRGIEALYAEAWGCDENDRKEAYPGLRLFCRSSVLRKILKTQDKSLIVLINLQRYEKQFRDDDRYTHSVGVALISKSLDVSYFKGRVNHLDKPHY